MQGKEGRNPAEMLSISQISVARPSYNHIPNEFVEKPYLTTGLRVANEAWENGHPSPS